MLIEPDVEMWCFGVCQVNFKCDAAYSCFFNFTGTSQGGLWLAEDARVCVLLPWDFGKLTM